MNQPPHGYGPPPGYGPAPGYGPQPPVHDPTKITATDIFLPILVSVFCGVGGFVWGLIRMLQGHHKPGWVAIGINAGVWAFGVLCWLGLVMLGMLASAATSPH